MPTSLTELTSLVSDLEGVPTPLAEGAILDAARDFCRRSNAWKLWINDIALSDGVRSYALPIPPLSSLLLVEEVWIGSTPMIAPGADEIRARLPDWATVKGGPRFIEAELNPPTVLLYPMPGPTDTTPMRVRVALMPARGADELSDLLAEQYEKALEAGAKLKLLSMPKKPWSGSDSDIRRASETFDEAVAEAAIKAARTNATGTTRAKTPRWGGA